jgi:hypothetical protein
MTLKFLKAENSLKEFLISLFLIFSVVFLTSNDIVEYYRSNYNGLLLLRIKESEINEFRYVTKNIVSGDKIIIKTLFDNNKEIKRWEYSYIDDRLREENFFQDFKLKEKHLYNSNGHKLNFIEYRDGNMMKNTSYEYNNDGLVSKEIINDIYLDRVNTVRYRYDEGYRIKQIITEMYDGRVVYWDSFFTVKGIIVKEYYTLDDKRYIFYYNSNGQEVKGEVILINDEEKVSLYWENTYSSAGFRLLKDEINYINNRRIKTWYDNSGREIKEHIIADNKIISIKEREFDKDDRIIVEKEVVGLHIKQVNYHYKKNFIKQKL